ncbi:tetratricopeptide repeat protein [Flavobacterium sp. I3-2]|uniref:tetratricopeptide repeat protein n=1 Tax=Flavobacterium sp. I3-2 TaxID=2748319 RepID=UPI0015B11F9A|nr:hypothetical protein [Flavobacterium sp. I3-2]
MKKLILLVLLFFIQKNYSQNVFFAQKNIYLAEYYHKINNDKKALDCYLKAIKMSPNSVNSYDYLNAAAIAFQLKKNKKAKEILVKSITYQLAPYNFIDSYEKLSDYKKLNEFKVVLKDYNIYEKEYFQNLKNPAAYLSIMNLITKDQLIRQNEKVFDELTHEIDEENINELMILTQKYGFEPRSWLILWHQRGVYSDESNIYWQFFKSYLRNEIKSGNLEKDFFVDFEEFSNKIKDINNGSIYTLHGLGNLGSGQNFQDIKNLDTRRKEVGLPPLYYEYFINNDSLPEEYEYDSKNLLKDLENL